MNIPQVDIRISPLSFKLSCETRPFLSHVKTHIQKTIVCERNNKRRYGPVRSTKLILESACIIASKLRLLPEPLDLMLREFAGGNGGGRGSGSGSWYGSGWGGFDGGKRKRKAKFGIIGTLVICGIGLCLVLGRELGVVDVDVCFGGLGFALFGFSVNVWRRGANDWILGFCCCAVLMGFVLKMEQFQRIFGAMKMSRRKRRRAFEIPFGSRR